MPEYLETFKVHSVWTVCGIYSIHAAPVSKKARLCCKPYKTYINTLLQRYIL